MTRVRMLVAYDGSGFAGFAPNPGVTTIGATLASTLERVLRHPTTVTCAGRTDAGVHAWGQVVTFDTDVDPLDLPTLQRSVNGMCAPNCVPKAMFQASGGPLHRMRLPCLCLRSTHGDPVNDHRSPG